MQENPLAKVITTQLVISKTPNYEKILQEISVLVERFKNGEVKIASNILFALQVNTSEMPELPALQKKKEALLREIEQLVELDNKLTGLENLWNQYLNGSEHVDINSLVFRIAAETQEINGMEGILFERKKILVGAILEYRAQQNTRNDIKGLGL